MQAIKSAGRYKAAAAAAHSQEPYDDSCDASFVDVGSFNDIDPLFLSLSTQLTFCLVVLGKRHP